MDIVGSSDVNNNIKIYIGDSSTYSENSVCSDDEIEISGTN